jgi:hypothetical protein
MALDFIQLTIERSDMHPSMIKEQEEPTKEWQLTALDRCDSCSAQAYVRIKGSTGELYFCGHHYDKIMNNPDAYTKMMAFMLEVLDERERLDENRSKGVSY